MLSTGVVAYQAVKQPKHTIFCFAIVHSHEPTLEMLTKEMLACDAHELYGHSKGDSRITPILDAADFRGRDENTPINIKMWRHVTQTAMQSHPQDWFVKMEADTLPRLTQLRTILSRFDPARPIAFGVEVSGRECDGAVCHPVDEAIHGAMQTLSRGAVLRMKAAHDDWLPASAGPREDVWLRSQLRHLNASIKGYMPGHCKCHDGSPCDSLTTLEVHSPMRDAKGEDTPESLFTSAHGDALNVSAIVSRLTHALGGTQWSGIKVPSRDCAPLDAPFFHSLKTAAAYRAMRLFLLHHGGASSSPPSSSAHGHGQGSPREWAPSHDEPPLGAPSPQGQPRAPMLLPRVPTDWAVDEHARRDESASQGTASRVPPDEVPRASGTSAKPPPRTQPKPQPQPQPQPRLPREGSSSSHTHLHHRPAGPSELNAVCLAGSLRTFLQPAVQRAFASKLHHPGYEYFVSTDLPQPAGASLLVSPIRQWAATGARPMLEHGSNSGDALDDGRPGSASEKNLPRGPCDAHTCNTQRFVLPMAQRLAPCYSGMVRAEHTRGSPLAPPAHHAIATPPCFLHSHESLRDFILDSHVEHLTRMSSRLTGTR